VTIQETFQHCTQGKNKKMKAKIGFQVWASGETGSLRILDRTSEFFSEYFGKGGKRGKEEEIYHY